MVERLSALLLAALVTTPVMAQESYKPIRFAPGTTATEIRGRIKGYDHDLYTLDVARGQVMHVRFSAKNRSCHFNAFAPETDDAVHNGSVAGHEFGASPAAEGRYRFHVYMMRNAARRDESCAYRLLVDLTG